MQGWGCLPYILTLGQTLKSCCPPCAAANFLPGCCSPVLAALSITYTGFPSSATTCTPRALFSIMPLG